MRVLVISEYLPYPPDHGGKIRVFELLRRVAQRHEVTLAALVDSDAERQHIPRLESYGIRVLAALRPPIGQDIRSKVRRLLDVRPRIMSESASPELRAKIRAYVRHRAPDVIHCEQLHVAQYAAPYSHIPGLLVAHTARYEDLVRQIAGARPTLQSRIAGRLDALKVRRIERRAWRTFIACAAVSEHDRAIILRHEPDARVYVVPNGVDTGHFKPPEEEVERRGLIITGNVGYYPNLDGLTWFLRDIFPGIRADHPGIELLIVGQSDAALKERIGNPEGVVLTGRVEDVRPYVARSRVFIVPLRIGGGTRLKILEAMAQGVPTVSTSTGCEGLDVAHGEHLLVADTAEDFIRATSRLLHEEALRQRLVSNARGLVVERYDWDPIATRLEAIYAELAGKTQDSSALRQANSRQ